MTRNYGTNIYGVPFDQSTKDAVWRKGSPISGHDPNKWRRDTCGHALDYSAYGNIGSNNGWEIDHIRPQSKGGTDDLFNLQPLFWETNRNKADTYPWHCGQ